MKKNEWLFARENEAAHPISSLAQLVATGVSRTSLMNGVRINKKFVKKATADDLAMVAVQWLAQGAKEKAVIKVLVKQKVEPEYAADLTARVKTAYDEYLSSPMGRSVLSKKYRGQMIWGFIWFAIGLAVTIGTFVAAGSSGTFYIMYGAIIWGIGGLIVGLIGWMKYRSSPK
jgi:hypothetical protein